MKKEVTKALIVTLGAAIVTKKKLEIVVQKAIKAGRIGAKEADRMVDVLYQQGKKESIRLKAVIDREVDRALGTKPTVKKKAVKKEPVKKKVAKSKIVKKARPKKR
ncbi:MAG: hypothetical protein ABIC95_02340 [archaeon]